MLPVQVHMLLDWAGRRKLYDPSTGNAAVMRRWGHLLRNVSLDDLKWTHDKISSVFRHGAHGGKSLWSLYDDLCSGATLVENVPALVVVRWRESLWAITGNRRLATCGKSSFHCACFAEPPRNLRAVS